MLFALQSDYRMICDVQCKSFCWLHFQAHLIRISSESEIEKHLNYFMFKNLVKLFAGQFTTHFACDVVLLLSFVEYGILHICRRGILILKPRSQPLTEYSKFWKNNFVIKLIELFMDAVYFVPCRKTIELVWKIVMTLGFCFMKFKYFQESFSIFWKWFNQLQSVGETLATYSEAFGIDTPILTTILFIAFYVSH